MGYYINTRSDGTPLNPKGKVHDLVMDGAEIVNAEFQPNLICVVDNGLFEAAGYCYSEDEFRAFTDPTDHRPKVWLVHPKAKELAG
jgi:hypothetical protein